MQKVTPFLWFNDNAGEAADFYLTLFASARKLGEFRSSGVGPQPVGSIVTVTLELEGQELILMNGGPRQQLSPAFSLSVACDSQDEIDRYWDALLPGGRPLACGWVTDRFGLCWQIVPRDIGKLVSHPKAMQAMMGMIKLDIATLKAAARED